MPTVCVLFFRQLRQERGRGRDKWFDRKQKKRNRHGSQRESSTEAMGGARRGGFQKASKREGLDTQRGKLRTPDDERESGPVTMPPLSPPGNSTGLACSCCIPSGRELPSAAVGGFSLLPLGCGGKQPPAAEALGPSLRAWQPSRKPTPGVRWKAALPEPGWGLVLHIAACHFVIQQPVPSQSRREWDASRRQNQQ